jgi:hypothetical protein
MKRPTWALRHAAYGTLHDEVGGIFLLWQAGLHLNTNREKSLSHVCYIAVPIVRIKGNEHLALD